MQKEKWSVPSNVVVNVQHNQHPMGHYELEVKVPEERYVTKIYKRSHVGEKENKEMRFDPNS